MHSKVLVVEDDPALQVLLARWLETEGFGVVQVLEGPAALQAAQTHEPHVVCLDLGLPGTDGMELLREFKKEAPDLPVIILTADDKVERVVEAMQAGAYNYLTKPLQRTKLVTTLRNASERYQLTKRVELLENEKGGVSRFGIVGSSPAMRTLALQIDQVAHADVTVLVQGDSGSGKELVARALHTASPRAPKPFIALNCAAIPENLQESELFGHERGAFTGAVQRHLGRFEQANGGTLFLDEVAELSAGAQAKLLRVLQEKSFVRVGGTVEVQSDFRLLAASHKSLEAEVLAGRFRKDLFYRLAVFELRIPPLRERIEDIPLLAQHFIREFGDTDGARMRLAPETLDVFFGYDWPGNVRELQNAIQRAVVLTADSVIRPQALPPRILATNSPPETQVPTEVAALPPPIKTPQATIPPAPVGEGVTRREYAAPFDEPRYSPPIPTPSAPILTPATQSLSLEEMEKRTIEDALAKYRGNVSAACRELGIGRTTIYRKMRKFGLLDPEPTSS
jgi:DNA-binding NtrC family response regulator